MAYFEDALKDVVGSYTDSGSYSTVTETYTDDTLNAIFSAAINDVTSVIPDDLLLKECTPTDLGADGAITTTAVDKRVLQVTRRDANSKQIVCEEINHREAAFVDNTGSYSNRTHANNKVFPVYWIDLADHHIHVRPALTGNNNAADSGEAYLLTQHVNTDLSTQVEAIGGVPTFANMAIIYKTAMGIIQLRLADAVEEDEDGEMQNLLNSQLNSLKEAFENEISSISGIGRERMKTGGA